MTWLRRGAGTLALAAALSLARPARADLLDVACWGLVASPCGGVLGAYTHVGVAQWTRLTGVAAGVGFLHQYPAGFEFTFSLPMSSRPVEPFLLASLLARVTVLRETLNEPRFRGDLAGVRLFLSLRAGVGFVVDDGSPFELAIGPGADVAFGQSFLVSLRPLVAVSTHADPAAAPGPLSILARPMIELSLGWLNAGSYP